MLSSFMRNPSRIPFAISKLRGPAFRTRHMSKDSLSSLSEPTVSEAYKEGLSILETNQVPDADDSARYLLCSAANLGYKLSDFCSNLDRKLTNQELKIFKAHLAKRLDRTPVQYIIGNWDFHGLQFLCEPPVLIPRPETEELVDYVIASRILQDIPARILDVGAGSGVIGITLLTKLPGSSCMSIDINPTAVSLANANAAIILGSDHSHRYQCINSSFVNFVESTAERFDIVVSNPPYIPTADIAGLEPEVRIFEDSQALDGGSDGLDIIRELIMKSSVLLRSDGPRELWMEVSDTHPALLEELLISSSTGAVFSGGAEEFAVLTESLTLESITDIFGNPRFVRLKYT